MIAEMEVGVGGNDNLGVQASKEIYIFDNCVTYNIEAAMCGNVLGFC